MVDDATRAVMMKAAGDLENLEKTLRGHVRNLREVDSNLSVAERNSKRAALTVHELGEMKASGMYRSVGKMFMKLPQDQILAHLSQKQGKLLLSM
jgi:hypothetical protein